jgi:hypothetical protein
MIQYGLLWHKFYISQGISGRDISDLISEVQVPSIKWQITLQLSQGTLTSVASVLIEIEFRVLTNKLSTLIFYVVELLDSNVPPVRNLDNLNDLLEHNERLVVLVVESDLLASLWLNVSVGVHNISILCLAILLSKRAGLTKFTFRCTHNVILFYFIQDHWGVKWFSWCT